MALNNARQDWQHGSPLPFSCTRRRLVFVDIALPVMIAAVHGPCRSEAWVVAPSRLSTVALPARAVEVRQRLAHGFVHDIREKSPPFYFSRRSSTTTTAAAAAAAVPPPIDNGEGAQTAARAERSISPPPPLPLEEAAGGMAASGGVSIASPSRRPFWQEQFASLRNNAADPWSARSNDDDSAGDISSSAPVASLDIPLTKNDVIAASDEESALQLTATAPSDKHAPAASDIAPAPSSPLDTPPEGRVAEEEAAEVMKSRGESDAAAAHRAFRLLDAELAAAVALAAQEKSTPPSSLSTSVSILSRSTAEALLSWIRCKTAGNGLVVADDGQVATSDTKEKQELWAEHAPRVLQLVKDVGKEPSSDPELQQIYTEAVMYSVSSQGIVEAFVTGKAFAFTSAMNALVKKFPTQDNGVAFIFQGSYFLAAPWPIRSPKKALECYNKAVAVNGRSRRNVYYAGLGRLACGDRKGAREMFSRAVSDEDCESASATERDIAASLREQAQRGVDTCGG